MDKKIITELAKLFLLFIAGLLICMIPFLKEKIGRLIEMKLKKYWSKK